MDVAQPLVTVITCYLNARDFLGDAIQSVLDQTYGQWEYILIDDGSSDQSSIIARQMTAGYEDKVRHVSHEGGVNRGLSYSRNLGISLARGKYICFLDADDVYMEGKLAAQVKILEADAGIDLLIEATEYWYPGDGSKDVLVQIGAPEGLYHPPKLTELLYPLGKGQSPCTSSYLLRTSSVEKLGRFEASFTGSLGMYEDQAFLCKYYLKGVVYVSDACHSRYRQHPESLMSSVIRTGAYRKVRQHFLRFLQSYLKEHGLKGSPVWQKTVDAIWEVHPFVWNLNRFLGRFKP